MENGKTVIFYYPINNIPKFKKKIIITKLFINRISYFFFMKTMNSNKNSLKFLNLFSKYVFQIKQSLILKFSIFRKKKSKIKDPEFQKMQKENWRSLKRIPTKTLIWFPWPYKFSKNLLNYYHAKVTPFSLELPYKIIFYCFFKIFLKPKTHFTRLFEFNLNDWALIFLTLLTFVKSLSWLQCLILNNSSLNQFSNHTQNFSNRLMDDQILFKYSKVFRVCVHVVLSAKLNHHLHPLWQHVRHFQPNQQLLNLVMRLREA